MAEAPEASAPSRVPDRRGLFLVYALVALLSIAVAYRYRGELLAALYQLQDVEAVLGPLAPLAMATVCGLWGTLCLPGPLMQGVVGTIFASNLLLAVAVVTAGEAMAQMAAFSIARYLGRERVRRRLEGKPWFAWLEGHIREKGVYGVFLVRLMPFFPNALGSYAFGLTSLRFWPYTVASVLGSLPKMFLYIFGTTSVVRLVSSGRISNLKLATAVALVVVVTFLLRRFQVWLRRRGRLREN